MILILPTICTAYASRGFYSVWETTHFAGGHAAVDDDEHQGQNNNDDDDSPQPRTLVSRVYHRLNKAALQHSTTNSTHQPTNDET